MIVDFSILLGWPGVELLGLSLIAAIIAAVAGFGGSVILLPLVVHLFGIKAAVPILTVAQLFGNASRAWFGRHTIDWPVVGYFCLGCIPSAIIGAAMFSSLQANWLKTGLGVFLLFTLIYRHSGLKPVHMRLPYFTLLGAVFGWLSAVVGTVGPLVAPFFLDYGLAGSAYIASEAMTAVVMHITKGIVYSRYALLGWDTLIVGLSMGLVMVFGSYAGKKIVDRLPRVWFIRIVEAMVLLAGIGFAGGWI
ncbi:MAG: sulfite exporter TauE/SafE family protein [Deltaproteobacteria bacterium]